MLYVSVLGPGRRFVGVATWWCHRHVEDDGLEMADEDLHGVPHAVVLDVIARTTYRPPDPALLSSCGARLVMTPRDCDHVGDVFLYATRVRYLLLLVTYRAALPDGRPCDSPRLEACVAALPFVAGWRLRLWTVVPRGRTQPLSPAFVPLSTDDEGGGPWSWLFDDVMRLVEGRASHAPAPFVLAGRPRWAHHHRLAAAYADPTDGVLAVVLAEDADAADDATIALVAAVLREQGFAITSDHH
jgi:hypothetical protein